MLCAKFSLTVVLAAAFLLTSSSADALVLCKKRSGLVRVRDTCRKRETQIMDLAQRLQGEPGPAGPQGEPGIAASGAEYTARLAELEAINAEVMTQIADLQALLASVSLVHDGTTVRFSGVNVQIVSGSGHTEDANGFGNLIVGYNELRGVRAECEEGALAPSCDYEDDVGGLCGDEWPYPTAFDWRWGSHNVIIGTANNYGSVGGLVVGRDQTISDQYSVVAGGHCNYAEKRYATILGGHHNRAVGEGSNVSGGLENVAKGDGSSVIGGWGNYATGTRSNSIGGESNVAGAKLSVVLGGYENEAYGEHSTVSGGRSRTAPGEYDWVAGSLFEDE